MADTTETAITPDSPAADGFVPGDLDEVMSELGLEAETPEERAAMAKGEDPGKAKERAAARAKEERPASGDAAADEDARPGQKDKPTAKADDAEADAEQQALADWEAAKKRARERRIAARAGAKADPAPAAAAAPAPEPDKGKAKEEAKTPTSQETVKSLVADVIASLERIDAADEKTASGERTVGQVAKREVDLEAVKEKLGKLGEAIESATKGGSKERDEYAEAAKELRQRVQDLDDTKFVEDLAERTIDRMEAKLPHLSRHRNASRLVVQFATKFMETHNGKSAPLGYIAERVERVLARRAGEAGAERGGASNGAPAKPPASRKTTSASLSTPPSRRKDPDTRTPQQVEDDLAAAFPEYRD